VFNKIKYEPGKGWESWSEKEERHNAVVFNNWLTAELGSERKFNWVKPGQTMMKKAEAATSELGIKVN